MIAFGHTAVGVIVGVSAYQILGTADPLSGLLTTGMAGVVSHYITDFIPHGHFFGEKDYKKKILPVIIFDLIVSILLFLYLGYLKYGLDLGLLYVMFGIGGSQLPDVLDGFIYMKWVKAAGLLKIEHSFHAWLHWHGVGNKTLIIGRWDIWQLLVVLMAIVATM